MTDWTYGGFAKKYDMTAEKIEIGTGCVKVHDIMDPMPEWLTGEVLFCDPPCSQANLQAFATKANKGQLSDGAYGDFEWRLKNIIGHIDPKVVYLEVFKANFDYWTAVLRGIYNHVFVYPSMYYNKPSNKCWIIAASDKLLWLENFECKDESMLIEQICRGMQEKNLKSICDPCMGMGLVGYWANYYGVRFTGTELNPHRLAYMMERINQGRLVPKKGLDQVKNKG